MHCDSSQYGWGAVLNEQYEARGFWYERDRTMHITFKELKAVRLAVRTFLPYLSGRRVLLHEDNQAVVAVLTHLTSRSPAMMTELRKLWWILDSQEITIVPSYIRSAANIWADRLSRELDSGDWQLNPRIFRYLDHLWGPHSVDRFRLHGERDATALQLALAGPTHGGSRLPEALGCRLAARTELVQPPLGAVERPRRENSSDRAPRPRSSLPCGRTAPGFQALLERADDYIVYPPARDMFFPGRQGSRGGVGPSAWSVMAVHLPCRPGASSDPTGCEHSSQPLPHHGAQAPSSHPLLPLSLATGCDRWKRQPDWEASMRSALRGQLGEDSLGQQALDLVDGIHGRIYDRHLRVELPEVPAVLRGTVRRPLPDDTV